LAFRPEGLCLQRYFRRRRVRLSTRFRLRPESRFAFFATCCRYRLTISSPEAPATRPAVASKAAFIFSLTIKFASRRALLPPRISFIIRSAITAFASAANNIKGLNICCAPRVARRMVRNCSGSARQLDRQTERFNAIWKETRVETNLKFQKCHSFQHQRDEYEPAKSKLARITTIEARYPPKSHSAFGEIFLIAQRAQIRWDLAIGDYDDAAARLAPLLAASESRGHQSPFWRPVGPGLID
jgi:hypothetical protein